jgi:hypothetical protein
MGSRFNLLKFIRNTYKKPHLTEKLDKKRQQLQIKIDEFVEKCPFKLPNQLDNSPLILLEDDVDCSEDDDDDESSESEDERQEDDWIRQDVELSPEKITLPLPSRLNPRDIEDLTITRLLEEEKTTREDQAMKALEHLRLSLGLKAALYRKRLRMAKSQKVKTRTWKMIYAVDTAIRSHAGQYNLAGQALIRLNVADEILVRFPNLKKGDMKISGDVIEENRMGQRSEHVSWLWRWNMSIDGNEDKWLYESEFCNYF